MVKELNIAVCKGRHDIPQATDGAIYKNEISKRMLLDVQMLEGTALHKLWEVCYKKGYTDSKTDEIVAGVKLNLYVTGLTVAVISAIKAAKFEGMKVTLWHYNRDNNNYYPQEI